MPSNFELLFGLQATIQLRNALQGRSVYATSLSMPALQAFQAGGGQASLLALVQALAPGAGNLTPDQFKGLMESLGTGVSRLTGAQMETLVTHLNPLIPAQVHAVITALRAGLNPTQTSQLVTRLRVSLTPAQINVLACSSAAVAQHGNRRLGPAYLAAVAASARPGDGRAAARLIAEAATACENMADRALYVLCAMEAFGFPAAGACDLLGMLPNVPDAAMRHTKAFRFLRDANAAPEEWNRTVEMLRGFVTAGRDPHGDAGGDVLNPSDRGGAWVVHGQRARGNFDYLFIATTNRINYFCNAHTLRHCDFSDDRGIGRAETIEFWSAEQTWDDVADDIRSLLANHMNWMLDLADDAAEAGDRYAVQVLNNTLEVGINYAGEDDNDVSRFFINHFSPVGENRFSRTVLRAARHLFQ